MTLSLTLFKTGILFVDNKQLAFSSHDLAINAAFLDGRSNFHDNLFSKLDSLFVPEDDPSTGQIIRAHFHTNFIAWQNPDVVHPHLTRNGCQYFMAVFQLYPEHCVRKCFQNYSILFNECLFGHKFLGAQR